MLLFLGQFIKEEGGDGVNADYEWMGLAIIEVDELDEFFEGVDEFVLGEVGVGFEHEEIGFEEFGVLRVV